MKMKKMFLFAMVAFVSFGLLGLSGCDKLKKMMESKPKEIKGPKTVLIITKPSAAVRIVGGHKALIRKALKAVAGFRDVSVLWDKKQIIVGHTEDAETDKFLNSLRDYGYGVKLKEE